MDGMLLIVVLTLYLPCVTVEWSDSGKNKNIFNYNTNKTVFMLLIESV